MSKSRVRLIVFSVIIGAAASAPAQSKLPIAVDQRVRIWTAAAAAVSGRVAAVTTDTLQIDQEGRDRVTITVATVRRLEVSRGNASRASAAKKGAIRGALITGALGAISLGLQHDDVGENGSNGGKAAALGAWSGGLFGGVVGAAIGAARAGEKWHQVWP